MQILTVLLAVALAAVVCHDLYLGRLLDRVSGKYNASERAFRNALALILNEES